MNVVKTVVNQQNGITACNQAKSTCDMQIFSNNMYIYTHIEVIHLLCDCPFGATQWQVRLLRNDTPTKGRKRWGKGVTFKRHALQHKYHNLTTNRFVNKGKRNTLATCPPFGSNYTHPFIWTRFDIGLK